MVFLTPFDRWGNKASGRLSQLTIATCPQCQTPRNRTKGFDVQSSVPLLSPFVGHLIYISTMLCLYFNTTWGIRFSRISQEPHSSLDFSQIAQLKIAQCHLTLALGMPTRHWPDKLKDPNQSRTIKHNSEEEEEEMAPSHLCFAFIHSSFIFIYPNTFRWRRKSNKYNIHCLSPRRVQSIRGVHVYTKFISSIFYF